MHYLKTSKFWTVFLIATIASYLLTAVAVTSGTLLASLFMQYPPGRLGTLCGNLLMLYLTICAFRMARDSARNSLLAFATRANAR